MNFNTVNRGLHSNITSAELLVPENPPPMLDVQPVVAPQNNEVRAELAAVEDLADHQSIEAEEEGAGESLSSPKPLKLDLDTLLALPSELQSKILGHMTMQSLDDLAPLIEVIAQMVRMLQALEDAQRPADIISNLRQLAQLSLVNGNCTPQLSASIASLLETIDQEVPVLQASGVEEGPASKIAKLRALAHLAVENVCIDTLDLSNNDIYGQFKNCKQQLKASVGDASDVFAFKLVEHIIIDPVQLGLLPRFFSSSRSVTIHAKDIVAVSRYCTRVLGQLNHLTDLILLDCEQLSDVGALGQLSHLIDLQLWDCKKLSHIEPLTQLSNLTGLALVDCKQLSHIGALGQLSDLTILGLSNSQQLIDISPLENLRGLTTLYLNGCQGITDISPLTQLSNLQELDLTGCPNLGEASLDVIEDLRNTKNVNVKF